MKILLVCTAGMSTSLLVEKIKIAAKEQDLDLQIKAVGEASIHSEVNSAVDIILLAPQIRFSETEIKKVAQNIPVEIIELKKYGMMDGKGVLEDALKSIAKNK